MNRAPLMGLSQQTKRGLSSLLVAALLALQAMALLPSLHRLVHYDADNPSHQCAVTLLAQGHINLCAAEPPLVGPPAIIGYAGPLFAEKVLVSTDLQLLPSRGPPSFERV